MQREPTHKKQRAATRASSIPPVSSELRTTRRNLPHWQVGGAAYFVTFRVKKGILSEDERSLVLSACLHWQQRQWRLYAVVVMPDHVHLLAQPLPSGKNHWYPLGEILPSVKSYSAHPVNKLRRSRGAVWLDESFDRIVRDQAEFKEKLFYMAHNPVKAGLARTETEYPYFWVG